ncbi:metallophosphoesterase family protein [Aureimonas leprariae]|uniref:Serine/threonine protein phosphatase n=1 Tax=Plantimonas leprariae TaxID=2615207 RepID=A0A7V7PST9_9HYPH|nr:metallophosphoesterase family protein [Aureimonas leprariae]KAB0682611.1 serine/threonine protein phosphatase [Aureimonas leprariae]
MNYPGIGANEIVYAVGDVHGCADLLDALLERIETDRARRPDAEILEIYLGDYIDRGADSAGVIRRLRARGAERSIVCLLGNHEAMLLDVLTGNLDASHWLDNGGDATLASYGIPPPLFGSSDPSPFGRFPAADLGFLQSLRLTHRHGPYFFVHAGVRPGVPLDRQDPQDLVWIRDDFLDYDDPLGAVVVHGHTPIEEPEFRPSRINIDTGAVFTGRLTCLRIDRDGAEIL